MYRLVYFIGIFSVLFLSCKKDDTPQSEIDEGIIKEYLADNNLDATRHESGLHYIITKVGTGSSPTYYSLVKINYTGYLTNDTIFDSGSLDYYPLSGSNSQSPLIDGWRIGIPLLRSGGEGKLIIPSGLGYGSRAYDDIPANSVLIFDIALIDFK